MLPSFCCKSNFILRHTNSTRHLSMEFCFCDLISLREVTGLRIAPADFGRCCTDRLARTWNALSMSSCRSSSVTSKSTPRLSGRMVRIEIDRACSYQILQQTGIRSHLCKWSADSSRRAPSCAAVVSVSAARVQRHHQKRKEMFSRILTTKKNTTKFLELF